METNLDIWSEEFAYHLLSDLDSLGILVDVYVPHGIIVKFRSEEDINFYKISGRFEESYYLMFVGPNFNVDSVNLNTLLSPSPAVIERIHSGA